MTPSSPEPARHREKATRSKDKRLRPEKESAYYANYNTHVFP
jgi:hypothetical protein